MLKQSQELAQHADIDARMEVSPLLHRAWLSNPQLRRLFSLDLPADRTRFVLWFLLWGRRKLAMHDRWITDFRESPRRIDRAIHALVDAAGILFAAASVVLPFRLCRRLLHIGLDAASYVIDVGRVPAPASPTIRPAPPLETFGATLVGYARAELGLGQHLRNSALALRAAEVPFSVLDCSKIAPQRKGDDRLMPLICEDNPFPINVFHVSFDQMFNSCVSFRPEAILGRYNIGACMWELPRFPPELLPCIDLLDEIWAPSAFIREALSRVPIPVHHMPVCVVADLWRTPSRAEFGLAENHFLFAFSFDAYSTFERKNPAAVVRAFRRAFPKGDEPAGLVLKVMNADRRDPRWRALLMEIRADPRIKTIVGVLRRDDWLALLSLCDAYVSLHRSEGFGFGPAEAMCLGKPTVLTGYGGVTDFAKPDTAMIVKHRLMHVQPTHYPYGDGQMWADPDIEHAAQHMRDLMKDRDLANRVGMAGRDFMQRNHAPSVVGQIYRDRLRACLPDRRPAFL